jgi:hypothetical protein
MFSKSIPASTVTAVILNTTGYTADATLLVPSIISNGVQRDADSKVYYPKGIQIYNRSGADLEWLMLASSDEEAMYLADVAVPGSYPYFAFTLLPSNTVLSNYGSPQCYKFIIRAVSGGASAGIRIDFSQYV